MRMAFAVFSLEDNAQDNSRTSDDGKREFPVRVKITQTCQRSAALETTFEDGSAGPVYHSQYANEAVFKRTAYHQLLTRHSGSFRMGPHTLYTKTWMWLDEDKNLVYRQVMQVDMSMSLFLIPTGTAIYSNDYVFKRIGNE